MKVKDIALITVFSLFVLSVPSLAEFAAVEWARSYNGTEDDNDAAYSIAMDADGNTYVTGWTFNGSNYDYLTIKYAADGTEDWVKTYNRTGEGTDTAYDIAVDGGGNAYVTGYSVVGIDSDIVTIKYAMDGTEEWVKTYNGIGNGQDEARDIAVDADGNAYVTRASWNGSNNDFITIKYDTDGNEKWVKTYNGTGNSTDIVEAIAVDEGGNSYVSGYSFNGSNLDIVTIKYATGGTEEWVKTYNGTGNGDDATIAIVVDEGGNAYMTGYSFNGSNSDIITIKYDTDGIEQWTEVYGGTGNDNDYTKDIAVDTDGNVYVTGCVRNGGNNDYVTIKYDTDGTEQWTKLYNGTGNDYDYPQSIALDIDGNVYVTGYSFNGSNTDYATIKYATDGTEEWTKVYNGTGNGFDHAWAIAVDAEGYVYVSGSSNNGSNSDSFTIKYATVDCLIEDVGYYVGDINPASGCEICDPDQDPLGWTPDNTLCDDGNECTNDYCYPSLAGGCTYTYVSGSCDDGDLCTENDVCSGGYCTGTSKDCDDGDLCTIDSCDEATGDCSNTDKICDDENLCTDDSCDAGTGDCTFTNNSVDCTDDVFCNGADTCSMGSCSVHKGNPCAEETTCNEEENICETLGDDDDGDDDDDDDDGCCGN